MPGYVALRLFVGLSVDKPKKKNLFLQLNFNHALLLFSYHTKLRIAIGLCKPLKLPSFTFFGEGFHQKK
jgi:hypothetical protein